MFTFALETLKMNQEVMRTLFYLNLEVILTPLTQDYSIMLDLLKDPMS